MKSVKKVLLAGDTFVPETDLKQPGFTYSACGLFTKNKERVQKIKETRDTRYIYQNKLHKACFQHDMAYGDFSDLPRAVFDIRNKAFNIAINSEYDKYQKGFASMVYEYFNKKLLVVC